MTGVEAIAAVSGQALASDAAAAAAPVREAATASFGDMIAAGLHQMEAKVDHANQMVRAFAVDDAIPIHEVTIALEEARLAVELAMQVRTRVVEGYREIMNMQL